MLLNQLQYIQGQIISPDSFEHPHSATNKAQLSNLHCNIKSNSVNYCMHTGTNDTPQSSGAQTTPHSSYGKVWGKTINGGTKPFTAKT